MNKKVKTRLECYHERNNVEVFFDMINELIVELGIVESDPRLCLNVRNGSDRNRVSVNLNSRLVAGLKNDSFKDIFIFMLYIDDAKTLRDKGIVIDEKYEIYKGAKQLPKAETFYIEDDEFYKHTHEIISLWKKCCKDYFPTQQSSQYRRYHIPELYKLAVNSDFREIELDKINFNNIEVLEKRNTEVPYDSDILLKYIKRYKERLQGGLIPEESYKWKVFKRLYEKWDWSAEDTIGMLEETFMKGYSSKEMNLWQSGRFFPIQMVVEVFKELPGELYLALNNLLMGSEDTILKDDIEEFLRVMNKGIGLINKKNNKILNHYHGDLRAISLYLMLNEPDSNFLYKYTVHKNLSNKIKSIAPKKGQVKNYSIFCNLAFQIKEELYKDKELMNMYSEILNSNPEYYEDNYLQLLTQDFIYFVSTSEMEFNLDSNYWRIGCKDDKGNYAQNFLDENYVAIGWNDIGDLDSTDVDSKQDIIDLMTEQGYDKAYPKNVLSRKAGEIYNFYSNVKEGDHVLLMDGNNLIAIGYLNKLYEYDETKPFAHTRNVSWVLKKMDAFEITDGTQTTFYQITNRETINYIIDIMGYEHHKEMVATKLKAPLNQIFYGSPGTGKTYHSINHALSIIENKSLEKLELEERGEIKNRYDKYVKQGRIVFTTFHQSMAYEDFIEGIKPIEPKEEGDTINYRIEDGIFKQICEKADSRKGNLFEVLEKFKDEISEDEEKAPITIKSNATTFDVKFRTGNVLVVSPHNTTKKEKPWYTVNIDNIIHYFNTEELKGTNSTYTREITEFLIKERGLRKGKNKDNKVPYVLIIDEINRGNVSAILGELITLLEPDKRIGEAEALEINLPYSKKPFGVPSNLYIIGTMNTADRSVEALDTALRRRFDFTEMQPDSYFLRTNFVDSYVKLIERHLEEKNLSAEVSQKDLEFRDVLINREQLPDLQTLKKAYLKKKGHKVGVLDSYFKDNIGFLSAEVLGKMNARIEYLLDREHLIGHSYFFNKFSLVEFEKTFFNNIIPLLQEYFYGDYAKMSLVIGKGFFNEPIDSSKISFAEALGEAEPPERVVVTLKTEWKAGEFDKAINILLGNEE